ncbi:PRC-barrel domain-containing protein [Pannonibacter sp. Pt2]|uniref:PRC-barrel domain-containing protein n=1 Tax=Pannonibacter anstelovis TaxID=3121537 RepID=A0ABU7ZNR4_9HYPH
MKKLLMTTMLVSAFAATTALAQTSTQPGTQPGTQQTTPGTGSNTGATPGFTAPEGYARQDIVLTAEDLIGATIYDATGDSIGSVQDLVIDSSASGAAPPPASTSPGGTAGTPPAAGTDTTTGTGMSPDSQTGGTGSMPGQQAQPGTGGTTGGGSVTGPSGTVQPTPSPSATPGTITHVLLDVGGFLGIGQRRVAIPVSDLTVYANNSETRVYLPWTRDQIEALPEYDQTNPETLGRSAAPRAN